MKRTLLFAFVLCAALSAAAGPRSADEALAVARSFFARNTATRAADNVRLVAASGDLLPATRTAGGDAFYVFNQGDEAFVIVSGDDRMNEVLAYSDSGAFVTQNLPAHISGWLQNYCTLHASLDAQGTAQAVALTRADTRSYPTSVAPLLTVNWNQSEPYNNDCPLIDDERAVTGCVATG